jgi:dUTP pyrophosphatase
MKVNIEKFFSKKDPIMEQFIQLMTMPDDKFDMVREKMEENILNTYSSPSIRKQILEEMSVTPIQDLDEELKNLENLINEIENDDSLSKSKKSFLIKFLRQSAELTESIVKIPREFVEVKIQKIHEDAIIPQYAHTTDAGADIYAIEDIAVKPHTTVLVKTGLKVAIPTGYEIQIRPRSGMSLKTTMRVANTPGTIDAGYRGEVCVIMENTGNLTYNISKGDKIAQMVIMPVPMIKWIETNELDTTDRGEDGFGSTDQE